MCKFTQKIKVMKNYQYFSLFIIIVTVFLSRLLPHMPNFTATSAAILFTGVCFGKWRYFFSILTVYFIADLIINKYLYPYNQYNFTSILFIYLPFFLNFLISKFLYRDHKISSLGIVKLSLISSIIFFIISNFGVWVSDTLYAKNLSGLVLCYWSAIPFFTYEFIATLFFSIVFFGFASLFNINKKLAFELR
jgi:hypothetical protein